MTDIPDELHDDETATGVDGICGYCEYCKTFVCDEKFGHVAAYCNKYGDRCDANCPIAMIDWEHFIRDMINEKSILI